jgi:hypothetical protein
MQAQPAPQPAADDEDLLNEGVDEILAEHGDHRRGRLKELKPPVQTRANRVEYDLRV